MDTREEEKEIKKEAIIGGVMTVGIAGTFGVAVANRLWLLIAVGAIGSIVGVTHYVAVTNWAYWHGRHEEAKHLIQKLDEVMGNTEGHES